jgi:hypothetical protein
MPPLSHNQPLSIRLLIHHGHQMQIFFRCYHQVLDCSWCSFIGAYPTFCENQSGGRPDSANGLMARLTDTLWVWIDILLSHNHNSYSTDQFYSKIFSHIINCVTDGRMHVSITGSLYSVKVGGWLRFDWSVQKHRNSNMM